MQLINLCAAGLIYGVALARPAHVRRGVDCAFSTTADSGATCETFASSWGISVEDLKSLNPQLECPKLESDDEYCVIGTVTDDPPTAAPSSGSTTTAPVPTTASPSSTITTQLSSTAVVTTIQPEPVVTSSTSTTSAGNGIATPQPTQPGMVSNCNKFHYVAKGVTCNQIYSYQKISLADFVRWNPTLKADCSGLWAEINVCVGVIGGATTTTTPSTTAKAATTTSAGNGVTTPTPIQPGMVGNCAKFHWVAKSVTCNQIISFNKITLASFYAWNPAVKADCSGLWAEVNVCVGLIGGTPTTTQPTTTKPAGNGIATPTPIQPGMVSNCKKFHYVAEGVLCSQITSFNKISLADFVKWNTGIGSSCNNMWSKTYVCVGV